MLQAQFKLGSETYSIIALGSNGQERVEDNLKEVESSLKDIEQAGLRILNQSSFYQTPCFPAGAGPDFVNAVVIVESDKSARAILDCLHEIEHDRGRIRAKRWGQRVIDIDLLAKGEQVCPDADTVLRWVHLPLNEQLEKAPDQLILPHPRIQDRGFVLVPLVEIAPDWRHPVLGLSAKEMLEALPAQEMAEIKRL